MIEVISMCINEVLYYVQAVFRAIFGNTYAYINAHLMPLFYIGIGISVLLLAIKIIRSTVWGR